MEKLTLLEELTQLRNSIRAKGGTDGKALQVCTDPALAELARLKPKQQKELLYIKGLGKTFAEKYGEQFLAVIAKHTSKGVKSSMLCPEVKETLKNLENRLVNINKRNRLLYMPKISRGTSADLAKKVEGKVSPSAQKAANDYNNKLVEFIKRFDSAKRFLLCDISDGDEALKKHKTLSNVVRESMRSMRETGENPLYIAYPFCIGKLPSEDFEVRAPLVLFPVEIIRDAATIVIKMDTSKDVLFNSGLLLSHKKFSASNEPLPSPVFEDLSSFKFFDQVKSYYAESGLPLKMKEQEGVKPFEEYLSGKFPKFKPGELYLEERVVLGKFPIYSSALQRDFRSIRESDKINELLNHLLERSEDIDIYAETTTTAEMPHILAHSEKNITYINDLNMSQEAAIFTATAGNKLVIQGPPGTGKSQVITSLISDAVVKGKNVLMVSQKKAALDVIYSRLGNANPYAVFISDMKAKEDFYKQMYRLFTLPPESPFSPSSIQSIADRIDGMTNRLDILGTKMFYSEEAYGTPVFEIYEDNVHANAKSTDPVGKAFFAYCPEEFYALGYPKIKDLQHYFSDPFLFSSIIRYFTLADEYAWLYNVKEGFTTFQIREFLQTIDKDILDKYVEVEAAVHMLKLFIRGRYLKPMKRFMKANFKKYDRKILKKFKKDPVSLYNGIEEYISFHNERTKYDALEQEEKLFISAVYRIAKKAGVSPKEVLKNAHEYAALHFIDDFETQNRDALTVIDSHALTVRDIVSHIDQKRDSSKNFLKSHLHNVLRVNILESKRSSDIHRAIDGKRRLDIARFINRFAFELFKGVRIWLMTPEVVSEALPLETGLFDVVIFDEASQIYIEKGVPSISRAKKIVIAGDHKQLRPSSLGFGRIDYDDEMESVDETPNAALEEESLLDLARFKYPEVMLDYHYRSRFEELIAFSNAAFYKGRLNVSPNAERPVVPPIRFHYIEDGLWEDRRNHAEADRVVKLIRQLLAERKAAETIGVITFNSAQRDLIMDKLDEECGKDSQFAQLYMAESQRTHNGEDIGLFIKNIENVQGDERDIIIFSLAYAKNESGKVIRNFGWLNQAGGENRLNVAISRARQKIIVVSSLLPTELKVDDLQNEGPRIFKKYLEYAKFVSDGNAAGAQEVLESFGNHQLGYRRAQDVFAASVADALRAKGLIVEQNVGMGGYKIDMAIKDEKGKFVLGLDCDATLYRNIEKARERDVHREKYLVSRGWKLHRIWSSDWWRDRDKEISKIKAKM